MTAVLAALWHPFPVFLASAGIAAVAYCAIRDYLDSRRTVADVIKLADLGAERVAESDALWAEFDYWNEDAR